MEKGTYISGCMEWHLIAYMISLSAFIFYHGLVDTGFW